MLHEKSERQAETDVTGALFSRSVCSTSQVLPRILSVILYGPVEEFKTYERACSKNAPLFAKQTIASL